MTDERGVKPQKESNKQNESKKQTNITEFNFFLRQRERYKIAVKETWIENRAGKVYIVCEGKDDVYKFVLLAGKAFCAPGLGGKKLGNVLDLE